MRKNPGLFFQEWLERTPGLEVDGFNFWQRLEINILDGLNQEKEKIEVRDGSSFQNKLFFFFFFCCPWSTPMTDRDGCFFPPIFSFKENA